MFRPHDGSTVYNAIRAMANVINTDTLVSNTSSALALHASCFRRQDELLTWKNKYQELTGKPFDPPKPESVKKVKGPAKTAPLERAPGEKSKKVSNTLGASN